jgi:hypothetical protein
MNNQTDIDRMNKHITVNVMGRCWHEWKTQVYDETAYEEYCDKCRKTQVYDETAYEEYCDKCNTWFIHLPLDYEPNDFSSKLGFWELWEFAIKQDWWDEFVLYEFEITCINGTHNELMSGSDLLDGLNLINPLRFMKAIASYGPASKTGKGWKGC